MSKTNLKTVWITILMLLFSSSMVVGHPSVNNKNRTKDDAEKTLKKYVKSVNAINAVKIRKKIRNTKTVVESKSVRGTQKVVRIREEETGKYYVCQESTRSGVMESGFDGKRMWRRTAAASGYSGSKLLMKTPDNLNLSKYKTNGQKYEQLKNEIIDGKEYIVIKTDIKSKTGMISPHKYYLYPNTYYLKRIISSIRGKTANVYTKGDYRKVDGIPYSFSNDSKTPRFSAHVKTLSVKHNVKIDPSIFELNEKQGKMAKSCM